MPSTLTVALVVLIIFFKCNLFYVAGGACEKEADLNFDSCDLKHLNDDVLMSLGSESESESSAYRQSTGSPFIWQSILSSLFFDLVQDICNRIGLDMLSHVLPYLLDGEETEGNEPRAEEGAALVPQTYTHEDFVRGAEECLLIEDEMNRLEKDDPEFLAQLEREALMDDPDLVAEIVADVLKQDATLLNEIASKLISDVPELVKEMNGMLGEGEKLVNRPDVVGLIVAQSLSDEQNLDILDEFDGALSDHYFREDDWDEDPESIGIMSNEEL